MGKQIGKFLVAVGAIVENSRTGKVLMQWRSEKKDFSGGIWEYTTGRLNQFEDPEEGLRRELMEESGIEVEIVKPISIYHIFRGEKTAENELVGIIYWVKTDAEEIRLSEEHTKYKWVTPEEALALLEKPGMKRDMEVFVRERDNF
jgi:8-oxo-dGTP diphosphatase